MKTLKLKRICMRNDVTLAVLFIDDLPVFVTCEDPWNNNEKGKSCIPPGEYFCGPHSGAKYKNTFEIKGVQGRSAILFHWGNTTDNTEGCILLGMYFENFDGKPGVAASREAFGKFMLKMEKEKEFKLVIENG